MEKFLWVEKYRPTTVDECILPSNLKQTFKQFVKDKKIPNLILSGGAGVGKTTVANAMINEIGATSMMINGSEESGIDVLRTKIKNFASTSSLEGGRKYLILVLRTSIPDSSEPFIIIDVAPISFIIAFATVVLPTPAPPDKIILGNVFCLTNSLKVCFRLLGRMHSSTVVGRYFSTQRNFSISHSYAE